jgi:1-acyl-sn-glycerol-3-phosphate acyltransferase
MTDWHYETSDQIGKSLIERLKHFPREPDISVYVLRSAAALVLRAWLRVFHRLEIVGRENLPREGSFVLVANHCSHLDTLCLLSAIRLKSLHRAFPAAAADYFFTSLPRTAVAAIVVNALPFHRETHARQSLAVCRELLANPGNILILFPEGTRSTDGSIGRFKLGIGLLLAGTTIPAVPCRLHGAFEAFPKGAIVPRPRKVRLVIGRPREYGGYPSGKESAVAISEDLARAVGEL